MNRIRRITAAAVVLTLAFLATSGLALAAAKPAPAGKVNINTATAEQLQALPGVGEKLAARIVEYRQKSGGFKSTQELVNVRGVGEKSFQKIQGYLSVGDAAPHSGSTR
jgi:competence protein ComEA